MWWLSDYDIEREELEEKNEKAEKDKKEENEKNEKKTETKTEDESTVKVEQKS